jgi:hypothetical protein
LIGLTAELAALALSGLLLLAQFLHVSVLANLDLGSRYFTGQRDRAPDRELLVRAARLKRAREDHPSCSGRSAVSIWGHRASSPGSRWG